LPSAPSLKLTTDRDRARLVAAGAWTATAALSAESLTEQSLAQARGLQTVIVDVAAIEELDTYGAWLIERLVRRCKSNGLATEIVAVPERFKGLLEAVHEVAGEPPTVRRRANPL